MVRAFDACPVGRNPHEALFRPRRLLAVASYHPGRGRHCGRDRAGQQPGLNFITSELHKSFGPIFRPTTPDAYKTISRENLGKRFDWLDKQLAGRRYLMGDEFTVADAYLFTVLRWSSRVQIDLGKWPSLKAYMDRVAARPKVQAAMKAEGLMQ